MAQHDYNIANQAGAQFRSDLNDALQAIVSNNSGATEPATTYAHQWWADTTAGILKRRNAANDAWISVLTLSTGEPIGLGTTIQPYDANTAKLDTAQSWTAAQSFTTFTSNGIDDNASSTAVTLDSSGNVGIGTSSPVAPLQINDSITTSVGTSSGDWIENLRIYGNNGNATHLSQYTVRDSNGTNWNTSGTRLQEKVGETYMGWMQFNGTGNNFGISFGTGFNTSNPLIVPERMRIDSNGYLKFDSGYGSVATAYGCRAWVNFNGTGTVAIRASGNVSSITDLGTGYYRVNFSALMPDGNYAANVSTARDTNDYGHHGLRDTSQSTSYIDIGTATAVVLSGGAYSDSPLDHENIAVLVFR